MKKIGLLIVMLLSMATSLMGKCDWKGVYLGYGFNCNVYKFEVTGTSDTCWKTTSYIYNTKTGKVTDTFYTRTFTKVFYDTGTYKLYTKVVNKCTGCDTSLYRMVYVNCKPTTKPKCDWSKLGFGYGYSCNIYKFELGSIDTCLSYTTYIYSYKTSRVIDTFYTRTFVKVFSDTGKYKVYVLSKNKCGGCDTSFYRTLFVNCKPTTRCNWSKIGISYSNRCDTVTFEMGSYIDTCIQYSSYAYQHKTKTWFGLSDKRVFRKGLDTGSYTIKTKFYNKCSNCDTVIYKEIYIKCDSLTNGLKVFGKNNIQVFPNPADNRIMVCITNSTRNVLCFYDVYNGSGKNITSGVMNGCVTLNTSQWVDGVYVFKSGNSVQRFIVKH